MNAVKTKLYEDSLDAFDANVSPNLLDLKVVHSLDENSLKDRNYILNTINSTLVKSNNLAYKRMKELEERLSVSESQRKSLLGQIKTLGEERSMLSATSNNAEEYNSKLLRDYELKNVEFQNAQLKLEVLGEKNKELYELLENEVLAHEQTRKQYNVLKAKYGLLRGVIRKSFKADEFAAVKAEVSTVVMKYILVLKAKVLTFVFRRSGIPVLTRRV